MDAPIIDAIVVGCLFEPRYMTLSLCVQLESVSKLFEAQADMFYRKLESIDVKDFMAKNFNNVNWARKVYRRCPKLRDVLNFQVTKDKMDEQLVSAQIVGKMTSVSRVTIQFTDWSRLALLPFVGMTNLREIEIDTQRISYPSFGSSADKCPLEKLRVMSLTCDRVFLVNFCDPRCLSVLRLKKNYDDIDEMIETLRRFTNLTDLAMAVCEVEAEELLKLSTFVCDVLQVGQFSLQLYYELTGDELQEIARHQKLRSCITSVIVDKIGTERLPHLLQMRRLESLDLYMVTCPADDILKSLPHLTHFEYWTGFCVEAHKFHAQICFNTIYKRRLADYHNRLTYKVFTVLLYVFRQTGSPEFNISCDVMITKLEHYGSSACQVFFLIISFFNLRLKLRVI